MDEVRFVDIELSKQSESFAAAIDKDGFLYSWGQNQYGQLGVGDFRNRKLPTKIPQLRKKHIRSIACGAHFLVALGKDVDGSKPKKERKHQLNEG